MRFIEVSPVSRELAGYGSTLLLIIHGGLGFSYFMQVNFY